MCTYMYVTICIPYEVYSVDTLYLFISIQHITHRFQLHVWQRFPRVAPQLEMKSLCLAEIPQVHVVDKKPTKPYELQNQSYSLF